MKENKKEGQSAEKRKGNNKLGEKRGIRKRKRTHKKKRKE